MKIIYCDVCLEKNAKTIRLAVFENNYGIYKEINLCEDCNSIIDKVYKSCRSNTDRDAFIKLVLKMQSKLPI